MKHCPNCKAELENSARFCLNCMTSLQEKTRTVPPPVKWSLRLTLYRLALPVLLAGLFLFCGLIPLLKDEAQVPPSDQTETDPATEEEKAPPPLAAWSPPETEENTDPSSHSATATEKAPTATPPTATPATTPSSAPTATPTTTLKVPPSSATAPTTTTKAPSDSEEGDWKKTPITARGTTGNCTWEMYGTVLCVFGGTHTGSYELTDAPGVWAQATKIVLEEGVTHVGEEFSPPLGWKALTEVVIPDSLEYIGSFSLNGPWKNALPDGVIYLDRFCFGYKGTVPSTVRIKEGTTQLVGSTFWEEKALQTVILPSTVEEIGFYAFAFCENLQTVYLPRKLTNVGYMAFDGCTALNTVYYEGTEAEWQVFYSKNKSKFSDCGELTVYCNTPAP